MKYIKKYDFFILEKKMDIKEYPNKESLGLVVKNTNRNGRTIKQLELYDFKSETNFGYIELRNTIDKNVFEIERAYAVKNWGPLLYDYALMFSYPLAVAPSKTIKPAAINVWKYYYEMRPDVIKKEMGINDESYMNKYKNDEMDEYNLVDDNLIYLNTYYYLSPTDEFNLLIEKGNFFIKHNNKKPSDIFKLGKKEFNHKYLED